MREFIIVYEYVNKLLRIVELQDAELRALRKEIRECKSEIKKLKGGLK